MTLLGAVVVAMPFLLAWRVGDGFGTWRSLASTALINVGTTLLLAALLVWLERRFIGQAEGAARRVVAEETVDLRQATEDISQKLEALQDRVAERSAAAEAAGVAIVEDISSNVSFETVTRALELANDVNALWYSSLAVPTNASVDAPSVRFSWSAEPAHPLDDEENLVARLQLDYTQQSGSNPRVNIEWGPALQADEVVHKLKELIIKAGYGQAAQGIEAGYMFERFSRGVRDAIAGRRASQDAWLKDCGELDELIATNLAVTSLGIAAVGKGLVLESDAFPQRPGTAMSAEAKASLKPYRLPTPRAPEGVDPDHWLVAIERAARRHPPKSWDYNFPRPPGPTPITSENSPLRR